MLQLMLRCFFLSLVFVWMFRVQPVAQTTKSEPAQLLCPEFLGIGSATNVPFCDVLIQRDPELGIRVVLPSRRGESTLSFNLHNRHTYSQSEEQEGRAYTQYLATVSMASMEGEIIGRGVVLSEFREAVDLVDRVLGDVEGSGLKAVAPTGVETVSLAVPEDLDELVIVGQSLEVMRVDGRDVVSALGRPVAVISNATIEYRPR
tara:strand:- start:336 stop:947 length:612 start_codon:yes stop_codon:yes gene_type:complete